MIGGPCVPPDDFTFTEANGETFEPYFVLDNAGLEAINTEECFDLVIPNVISPNQDGINDLFKIDNLPVKTELIILNRWGLEVFYSDSYQNNWDGRDKSGKLLSDGVYTYKLKPSANNLLHGFIHVVR